MAIIFKYIVCIDFDNDGFAGADDISAYVVSVDGTLGFSNIEGRVADVGSLTLKVENSDKRFSPGYTSSPYYGRLLPNSPVRVQATDGTTTWTIFRGYVQQVQPDSGLYGERKARIECVDALGILQNYQIALPLQENKYPGDLLKLISSAAYRTAYASGTLTLAGQPANNDTFTLDGRVYTFKSALSGGGNTPYEVLIGATIEATVDNIVAAVNAGDGAGTLYGSGSLRAATATAAPRSTYYRLVQQDRAVRYYRLGESAGTNAADGGLNRRDGTYTNSPTLNVAGALANDPDKAVTFDGTNDYVDVPTFDLANSSFSIELWVKPTAAPPGTQDLFSVWSAYSSKQNLNIRLYNGTDLYGDFYGETVGANGVVTVGSWNHIVLSYNYATDTSTLYVNGAQVAQGNAGPFAGTSPTINIGALQASFNFAKATIDEVAVYFGGLSAAQVAAHYAAQNTPLGVTFSTNARGAWGNAITLAKSGANLSVSGATLSGGVDGPAGLIDYENGVRQLQIAGDRWTADNESSALDAATDVVRSEYGLLWCARNGTLTFRGSDYMFKRPSVASVLTVASDHNGADVSYGRDGVSNRVVVSYTPRSTLATGVVAKAASTIAVPGLWGNDRYNSADDLPAGGYITVKIPYVDTGTGQLSGAKNLILPPVPYTDFTINEAADGTLVDYTTNGNIKMSIAINGSAIELSARNTALGIMYIRNFQVRGDGIVAYQPQQVTLDDSTSQNKYGRIVYSYDLPLPALNAQQFAESLAAYLLSKWKDPALRITGISFEGQLSIGAVHLYALEIGDVITVADGQQGTSGQKYMIMGIRYTLEAGNPARSSISFALARLDDTTYWILEDATYGVLGTTTRLGL